MPFAINIFFISSSLVGCYYAYGLRLVPRLTILYIGKRRKMVKVLNSMTRNVCVIYNVFGLCILHGANLLLSGSHHYDILLKNTHYISKIDNSLVKYDIFLPSLSNRDNTLQVTECVIQRQVVTTCHSYILISNHADEIEMPWLFMITDKYYDGPISPSKQFLRNPILIINAGEGLVN